MLFGGIILFKKRGEWIADIDVSVHFAMRTTLNMPQNERICCQLGDGLVSTWTFLAPEARIHPYDLRPFTLETMLWDIGIILTLVVSLIQDPLSTKKNNIEPIVFTLSNIGPKFNRTLFNLLPLSEYLSADAVTMIYICSQSNPEMRLQMFINFWKNLNQRRHFLIWNSQINYDMNKRCNEGHRCNIPVEFNSFINNTALKIQEDLDIIASPQKPNFCHVEVFFYRLYSYRLPKLSYKFDDKVGMKMDNFKVVTTILEEYKRLLEAKNDWERKEYLKYLLMRIFAPIYQLKMEALDEHNEMRDTVVYDHSPMGPGKFLNMWNIFFDGLQNTKEYLGCDFMELYNSSSQYFVPIRSIPKLEGHYSVDKLECYFKAFGIFIYMTVITLMINFPNFGTLHDGVAALEKVFIGKFPPFFIRFLLHKNIGKGHWWYRHTSDPEIIPNLLDWTLLHTEQMKEDMPEMVQNR